MLSLFKLYAIIKCSTNLYYLYLMDLIKEQLLDNYTTYSGTGQQEAREVVLS